MRTCKISLKDFESSCAKAFLLGTHQERDLDS